MADFNETAEFVRRWAERQRDIIALGDALKEIGSVSLAATERKAALDKMTEDLQTATDSLAAKKAEHEAFMAGRAKDIEDHQTAAQAIADKAQADANMIVTQAQANAKLVIAAANDEAARIQKAHADTMGAANTELQSVRSQLDAAKSELVTAVAEQADIAKKIQDMRDLARATLGH